MNRRLRGAALVALAIAGISVMGAVVLRVRGNRAVPRPDAQWPPVGAIYKVASNLYVVPDGGGNTAVFLMRNGVLLVDTKVPANWDGLTAQIRTVTDKPITHVINTHFHTDHTGGNQWLADDVVVVQHANTARRLGTMPTQNGASSGRRVTTFVDRLTLFEGTDDAVDLYHFGPAHTDGDTLVVFRALGVMHAGDVFPARIPPTISIPSGGSGVTYALVLERAVAEIKGVTRVIPGHSELLEWNDFVLFSDLVRRMTDHVRTGMRFGSDKVRVFRSFVAPPAFRDYNLNRTFETMDEIDRSFRPWWQRVWS